MTKLLTTNAEIDALLARTKTVAVLGIKPASHASQPAHYVPRSAQRAGMKLIPVPVYYPEVTEILGEPVERDLSRVPRGVDLVNVFRRPSDLDAHLPALLAVAPRAVWLQSGIVHQSFADALVRAGVDVVMDRCLMVELGRR